MRRFFLFTALLLFSATIFANLLQPNCKEGNICVVNLESNGQQVLSSSAPLLSHHSTTIKSTSTDNIKPDFYLTKQNPTATVSFQSNPTTGYTWSATNYDTNLLTINQEYQRGDTTLIGAGGTTIFTVSATPIALNGTTKMIQVTFNYRRAWEVDVPPAKTKTVVIQIN